MTKWFRIAGIKLILIYVEENTIARNKIPHLTKVMVLIINEIQVQNPIGRYYMLIYGTISIACKVGIMILTLLLSSNFNLKK